MNASAVKDVHAGGNAIPLARSGLKVVRRSVFMRPALPRLSPILLHIPFLAWVVDTLKPQRCVVVGSFDAAAYFGLCQACTQFAPEAEVYFSPMDLDSDNAGLDEAMLTYATRTYPHTAKLSSSANPASETRFDLLLFIPGQGSASFEVEEWRRRLEAGAVVMVHGIRERSGLVESPDLEWILEFAHGEGLGVTGWGDSQSAIQSFATAEENSDDTVSFKELSARLGYACMDSVSVALAGEQIDELTASLDSHKKELSEKEKALKAAEARLKASALEIEELWSKSNFQSEQHQMERGRLLEKANLYREWRDECRAEADRLRAAFQHARERAARSERDFEIRVHVLEERSSRAERDAHASASEVERLRAELQDRFRELASLTKKFGRFKRREKLLRLPFRSFLKSVAFLSPKSWRKNLLLRKQIAIVAASGLFDDGWYIKSYPDVAASNFSPIVHFLKFGASEGRHPGPRFDACAYLKENPDVAAQGVNPLVHYLEHGKAEGRPTVAVK